MLDECLMSGRWPPELFTLTSHPMLQQARACLRKMLRSAELYSSIETQQMQRVWPSMCLQMSYAELLWLDQLGMYVSAESEQHLPQPTVVRVPFYRAVLDERDARR